MVQDSGKRVSGNESIVANGSSQVAIRKKSSTRRPKLVKVVSLIKSVGPKIKMKTRRKRASHILTSLRVF